MRSDLKKIGEQKSTYLVGQTERALYLLDVISTITDRGNNAEVRRKKDGTLTVYGKRLIFRYYQKNIRLLFSSRSTLTIHI